MTCMLRIIGSRFVIVVVLVAFCAAAADVMPPPAISVIPITQAPGQQPDGVETRLPNTTPVPGLPPPPPQPSTFITKQTDAAPLTPLPAAPSPLTTAVAANQQRDNFEIQRKSSARSLSVAFVATLGFASVLAF